jgi:hypothetical protein
MTFCESQHRVIYEHEEPMHFYFEMRGDYDAYAMRAAAFEAGVGNTAGADDIYWMLMFGA